MKPVMRTTIILDEDLRRKLKMLSLQKDISMREIITQALEEKISKDLDGASGPSSIGDNVFVSRILSELDMIIGGAAARALLAQKCKRFNVALRDFSRTDMNEAFIDSLCQGIVFIATVEDAARLKKKLLIIAREK
jgi:hypothetical protein